MRTTGSGTDMTVEAQDVVVDGTRPPARARSTAIVSGRTVGPHNLVALALGVTALVLGIVALARSGLAGFPLGDPHVVVGWLHHTPPLAIAHLVLGVLLLGLAAPGTFPGNSTLFGGVLLVVGIVLVIEPGAFHAFWGTHTAHGWTYIAASLLLVLSGLARSRIRVS